MNPIKHIKRLFKSLNKRITQPTYRFLKPAIRWIKNGPYEINLITNKSFFTSDFAVVRNVINYEHVDFNCWNISALTPNFEKDINNLADCSSSIYIILDTQFHEAFGHWFFESAIWIPKIKNILENYPNAKIHLKEIKGYKKQILEFFNIPLDRVTTKIDDQSNACVFTNPCTAINELTEHKKFKAMLEEFSREFDRKVTKKTISYLLMPRQKKDNYLANDRHVGSDDLESYLEKISSSKIFNTDLSPTFADQIQTVQSSKYILVTDGSPFLVNAFIARHSSIIVLGDSLVPEQRKSIEKISILCEHIEHHNAVSYVHSSNNIFTKDCISQWVEPYTTD